MSRYTTMLLRLSPSPLLLSFFTPNHKRIPNDSILLQYIASRSVTKSNTASDEC
jgi:hypothetical protein